MAGGGAVVAGAKPGVRYNARMTVYVWFCCILGGCGGLLLGYDNGVIGGVVGLPDFQQKFFPDVYEATTVERIGATNPYCKYDNQILQLVVSSLYLSAAASAVVASQMARMWGRQMVLFIASIFFLVGTGFQAGAVNVAMVVIGRVLLGVGVGLASLVMPIYNAEIAPPHMRGAMNILFQLFVTIGILAAGLINYGASFITTGDGWRMPLALAAAPAIITLIGSIVLPDSPNSYLERGHPDKARQVLERIRGTKEVDEEYADIEEAARLSKLIKHPMMNIFKPQYRPQLVISLLFMLFQQFTGINAIIFYAPALFNSIGSGHTAALLNTVIIGAVNVLSTLIAVALVDKLGRRVMLIAGGCVMIVAEIIVGVTLKYEFAKYGVSLPSGVSWGILAVICVYINGFAWSWGPIGWLYPTEIQPMETRAAGASINMASNMIFTFVIGQTFLTMLCSMEWGVFLFFAGFVIVMVLWVIFFLPETKGVPIEEVFRLFQSHWFWSKHSKINEVHAAGTIPTYGKGDDGVQMGHTAGTTAAY